MAKPTMAPTATATPITSTRFDDDESDAGAAVVVVAGAFVVDDGAAPEVEDVAAVSVTRGPGRSGSG